MYGNLPLQQVSNSKLRQFHNIGNDGFDLDKLSIYITLLFKK